MNKTHYQLENLSNANFINQKASPSLSFESETDAKLFRNPSNNIPKIILMIYDPVKDFPRSLFTSFLAQRPYPICAIYPYSTIHRFIKGHGYILTFVIELDIVTKSASDHSV